MGSLAKKKIWSLKGNSADSLAVDQMKNKLIYSINVTNHWEIFQIPSKIECLIEPFKSYYINHLVIFFYVILKSAIKVTPHFFFKAAYVRTCYITFYYAMMFGYEWFVKQKHMSYQVFIKALLDVFC